MAMTPLYNSEEPTKFDAINPAQDDAIKFIISVVNNDKPNERTWIHFRAFISGFSDKFAALYNASSYVGRAEQFFNYKGFKRDISFNLRIAAQSKQEQKPLYEKLTYLASLTAPDYSDAGFMRGNLIYLTIGDYLVDVPGIFNGMSLGGFDESPWEIARKPDGTTDDKIAQLPHTLEISGFSFTPIHKFVPQRGSRFIGYDNYDSKVNQTDLITPLDSDTLELMNIIKNASN